MTDNTPDNEIIEDLDALVIKKSVKVGGQVFKVNNIGVHQRLNLILLQKKIKQAEKTKNDKEAEALMRRMLELIDQIVPGLSASGVSVTEEQLFRLIEIAASKTGKVEAQKKTTKKQVTN